MSKNSVTITLCSYVTMSLSVFFCLIQKPHPLFGGEAVPQERENQINTLVLKDINFTINIIELSYYRTIDILNQSFKMLPWHVYLEADTKESLPKPLFFFHCKDKEGLGEAFFPNLPLVLPLLYSPFLSVRGRGLLPSSLQDYPHPPATPLTPCAPTLSKSMLASEL